jgi:transcription elongation factor SPT6
VKAFKYISGKPLGEISGQPQFLAMLAAEKEDLTTIEITLTVEAKRNLRDQLQRIYLSDFTSQAAQAWNGLRQDVLDAAINEHIVPSIARYAKAQLAKEAEESVLRKCRQDLETEIEAAPYKSVRMETGETPSVVAVSHGAGDPRRDHVVAVFLDASGRFRDQIKLDGLVELNNFNAMREPERKAARDADRNTFVEFLKHRKPDVVVVNGFTYSTKSLFCAVQALTSQFAYHLATERDMHDKAKTETIYVNDATARIYQHSKRAIEELPQLTTVARYCVGLARYTQSPLNEYAALGDQITSITFDPHQKYVSLA